MSSIAPPIDDTDVETPTELTPDTNTDEADIPGELVSVPQSIQVRTSVTSDVILNGMLLKPQYEYEILIIRQHSDGSLSTFTALPVEGDLLIPLKEALTNWNAHGWQIGPVLGSPYTVEGGDQEFAHIMCRGIMAA